MFSIFEPTCLLLIVIGHNPLNTFGGTIHKDSLSEIVKKLQNEIELMKKDSKNINITIEFNIELKESKLDDFLNYGRMQNENVSSPIQRSKQDNVVEFPIIDDDDRELRIIDAHFNCIRYCSSTSRSCDEALTANNFKEGVYLLKEPKSDLKPFYVYCIHEDKSEQGWMVIERRQDGSVSFKRKWLDYKLGFGELEGEYWIGLERLHQITNSKPHELWIVVYNLKKKKFYAKYSEFNVASENEGYKLTVGGFSGDMDDKIGEYNSMKFTTIDKDNDDFELTNCADTDSFGGGGWWYHSCSSDSDFNSRYFKKSNQDGRKGIFQPSDSETGDLRKVFMAIRPK